ncbi:uncharacterized protein CCOS01_15628 [Colletotrichum costaricense]|uniref:WD-like domain-containing protein n=2 Tax=Colletotrichum acutatum species complex TaxID=2707335 RepID=A0AAI9YGP5_9PEZI|nr:uncharacterized protein CCOS01_15628 [Colletotrichum costaricense]XP_060373550.1 uncharacterized protein CTAM01_15886 [Colletotrichum tamarilloi]KAK1474529.1 hypothetical protein CTAM01_15886 [Colletotrichum tamarilloi]KAK1509112.1 hypothetical protein CCOS01_15628 [Colletotrichum costaricense]
MIIPEATTALSANMQVARALPPHLLPKADAVFAMEAEFPSRIVLDLYTNDIGTFSVWGRKNYTDITITQTPAANGEDNTVAKNDDAGEPSSAMCGENELVCDKAHQAMASICYRLIKVLKTDKANDMIRGTPQDYCLEIETARCCVSWTAFIDKPTPVAELVPAAEIVYDNCRDIMRSYVSGKVYGAIVGNHCMDQCLSERPDGC